MVTYGRANRQYVAMSQGEVWRFLESQRRVFLAFAMADGFPHVTPIWFVVLNKRLYMRAQNYKVKVRLAETGKACVSIDEGDRYPELRGVVVWGASRLVTERALVRRITDAFEEKYAERQWKPSEMPASWVTQREKETRAFLEVTPEKIDSWDNSKVR